MVERLKPKRRESDPVRRSKKGTCVKCENYEPIEGYPCLWKLEAQIDKASQHMMIALSLIRKVTAKQRQLTKRLLPQNPR